MTINTSPVFSGSGVIEVTDLLTLDNRTIDFWIGGVRASADEKMIAFGRADQQLAVVQFNSDGLIDTTFGGGDGFSTIRLNPNFSYNGGNSNIDYISNLKVLSDGKLIFLGIDNTHEKHQIIRLNADGSIDTSFGGGDGKLPVSAIKAYFNADGTFFTFKSDIETGFPLAVTKYLASGSVDTSYGSNGVMTYSAASHQSMFDASAVVGDTYPDGKMISVLRNDAGAFITKNNANSSPDASFGNVANYTEKGLAATISNILTVSDNELGSILAGATLTLHRAGAANAEDHFSSSDYSLVAGSQIMINSSNVGSVLTNSNGNLVIQFNQGAQTGYVNGLIQSITYSNSSVNPVSQVSLEWSLNDGNSGSQGTGGALTGTTITTIKIASVNDAPIVANQIGNQTANQDAAFTFTANSNVFTDPEGDSLTYSAILEDGSNLPAWLTFDAGTRTFTGTPGNNQVGDLNISLIATDSNGASAAETFVLSVIDVNDAPVKALDPAAQFAKENTAFSFTLPAGMFTDPDATDTQTLTATLANDSALPAWLTFDADTGTFTGTPTNGDVGIIDLKVTVTDKGALTASSTFSLDVANIVAGTAAADTLDGGIGSNFYTINNIKDVISEAEGNAGTDTAEVSISKYTLAANVERMILVSNIAGNLTGNDQSNYIQGNTKNDALRGDTKTGSGNDTIDGGAGRDTMSGGKGNDVYYVDNAKDIVVDGKDSGSDTIYSSVSFNLNAATIVGTSKVIYANGVENLTLTGTANINATGNTLNNYLVGNSGNNIISGGTGNDSMFGGAGDDTYTVNTAGDQVAENFNEGIDTVKSSASFILGDNFENLELLNTTKNGQPFGNPLTGTGNDLNNVIKGNLGHNTLTGNLGNDILLGSSGNDTLIGGAGKDVLDGGSGTDSMTGGSGDDTYTIDSSKDKVIELSSEGTDTVKSSVSFILGDNLENLILIGTNKITGSGNSLDNAITGNGVSNTLYGGEGEDIFIFSTKLGSTNVDKIMDFSQTEGDKIGLSKSIFTALGDSLDSDEFASGAGLTKALTTSQHLIYNEANGNLYYDVDGSGSKAATLFANIHDGLLVPDMSFNDLVLI